MDTGIRQFATNVKGDLRQEIAKCPVLDITAEMILQCVMAMGDVGLGSLVMVYVIVAANQS